MNHINILCIKLPIFKIMWKKTRTVHSLVEDIVLFCYHDNKAISVSTPNSSYFCFAWRDIVRLIRAIIDMIAIPENVLLGWK